MYRVIAQWAFWAMFLAPLAEDALHEGTGTSILNVAENRDVVRLLGLPPFFDAVVDKSDEASCNDYAI